MNIVILERDGVITSEMNASDSAGEPLIIPGSLEAIAGLNQAGYRAVIAMNHPADKSAENHIENITAAHRQIHHSLEQAGGQIDAIFFCTHQPSEQCSCRLPKPGMLLNIAMRYRVDLTQLSLIGCSESFIAAGQTAGIRCLAINSRMADDTRGNKSPSSDTALFDNLTNAVQALIHLDQTDRS